MRDKNDSKKENGKIEILESSGMGSGDGSGGVYLGPIELERTARTNGLPNIFLSDDDSKYITSGLEKVNTAFNPEAAGQTE